MKSISLVLATSNNSKFVSLRNLIKQTNLPIRVKKLPRNISPPKEYGVTVSENAAIKARFYSKLLAENLMVADDGLYIDGFKSVQQVGPHIKRVVGGAGVSDKKIFEYWWNLIPDGKLLKARRIRKIVIVSKDKKKYYLNFVLKISLMRPKSKPAKILDKPLNYFMIPLGYKVPISQLTQMQRIGMQEKSLRKLAIVLKKLSL
jgi:inosine/xanthosine triphosphate pyrophosphatase family protein